MQLADVQRVYFIGIGGIGMSAVARYFNGRGIPVAGYDKTRTVLTDALEAEGMNIHFGDARTDLMPAPADDLLVVWTPAIPRDFPELAKAQTEGYHLLKRAAVLGLLSKSLDCVGIAGTHGKTTTTTITTHLMTVAGLAPHAFLGGIPRDFAGNYVAGNSDWVIAEADEYDRSFLQLEPTIAVILSADPDHLDIYGDHENMLETGFRAYARRLKPGGHLLVRHDIAEHFSLSPGPSPRERGVDLTAEVKSDMNSDFGSRAKRASTSPLSPGEGPGERALHTFGIETGHYAAQNIQVKNGAFHFDLKTPTGHLIPDIRTSLPGRHNVENAVAACAVTLLAGGSEEALRTGLSSFRGIARRFDTVLKTEHLVIIDDYAHHPTELDAAINAARELYPHQTIRGVFQPHLFSRTQDFAAGFAHSLDALDEAVLIPIYPAREEPIPGVTSQSVYDLMNNPNRLLLSDAQMLDWAAKLTDGILLLLGAGDIDKLVPQITEYHQNTPTHG